MNKKDEWITRAVHVLRKVEFSGTYTDYDDPYDPDSAAWKEPCCPYCGTTEEHEKGDDCELYRLLEETKDIK